MPRFGLDTGFPASNPWHRFTLTRLPEPSVLAPGTVLTETSWGGPSSFGSFPRLRCLLGAHLRTEVRPKATSVPGCLAVPLAGCGLPRALRTIQQVSVSAAARRRRRPGLTRRPPWFPTTFADSSLPSTLPKESDSPVRGGREHCPCSDSAAPRERCGLGRSPLLTAPVGVRSPERASVNTPQNPRSRGISKNTGLSPELSGYPQDCCGRPLVAHRSCTAMCTAPTSETANWPSLIASCPANGFNGGR